ncbi:uncharacterized protein LOC123822430 [Phyllostomus hastatus]|uniref:uncharacterized protein LOC123822430 n=1 Tax=Phyllostomus hastatus TaxID=9423 RepID=UPI001E681E9E|nr:uncharacterized protein LOC123822430 [Phyllostomus hastatus]
MGDSGVPGTRDLSAACTAAWTPAIRDGRRVARPPTGRTQCTLGPPFPERTLRNQVSLPCARPGNKNARRKCHARPGGSANRTHVCPGETRGFSGEVPRQRQRPPTAELRCDRRGWDTRLRAPGVPGLGVAPPTSTTPRRRRERAAGRGAVQRFRPSPGATELGHAGSCTCSVVRAWSPAGRQLQCTAGTSRDALAGARTSPPSVHSVLPVTGAGNLRDCPALVPSPGEQASSSLSHKEKGSQEEENHESRWKNQGT